MSEGVAVKDDSSLVASFWSSSDPHDYSPRVYQAQAVTMWKCGKCFVNLNTQGKSLTRIRCVHCGELNDLSVPGAEIRRPEPH